jgi:tetratricopeptide (TPR) repeat protein
LPERDVLDWMIGICEALEYLHGRQPPIIVRDLKPGNIMVTPRGDVRLIDLGIARTYKHGKLSNTENLGTMTYASPEHLGQAQTDSRSDIYSLGATMFHLLTGIEPTPMETPAPGSLRRHQPALSEATEAAVIRALRLNPTERFQTAAELRDALMRCRAPLGPAAPTVPTLTPQRAPATAPVTLTRPDVRPVAASARAAAAVRRATSATAGGMPCPRCGFLNRRGAKFCARDGVALAASAVASVARPARTSARSAVAGVAAKPTAPVAAEVTTAELSVRRATEAFAGGRFATTVRQCETAIAQGRATYDVYLLLGQSLAQLGRHAEAAAAYGHAAALRPTVAALRAEGEAARQAGDLTRAQIAFTRARQLDPRDADVCRLLGLTCLDLGQPAQAEGELRAALELNPGDALALVGLGRAAAAAGRWDEAIAHERAALAAQPDEPSAHLELGRALLARQRTPEAVRALEAAVRLAPDFAEARKLLGLAYHASGRRTQARVALRRATELDPHDVEARRLLKHI